jgi:hypothetical protein
MTRDEIIAANPIVPHLERQGFTITRKGKESFTLCPFHDDHHPSMRVNAEKGTWYCDPCGIGGSVIDFEMRRRSMSAGDVLKLLDTSRDRAPDRPAPRQAAQPAPPAPSFLFHKSADEYAESCPLHCIDRTYTF